MGKIISVHSFRGGTGKSNTTAGLAALLAARGLRVGVMDTDIQSPGIHVLFGLPGDSITRSLNDYLWGRCPITDAAYPVLGERVSGSVFLIPSSLKTDDILQVLRHGYDITLLTAAFRELSSSLALDVLLIDTHPGLNEETLFSLAIAGTLIIVLRPDQQDYEGTGVAVQVARSLQVPDLMLLVNKAPPELDPAAVRQRVEAAYSCRVAAVLPHADELMSLASADIFALRYPDHPITVALAGLAHELAPVQLVQ